MSKAITAAIWLFTVLFAYWMGIRNSIEALSETSHAAPLDILPNKVEASPPPDSPKESFSKQSTEINEILSAEITAELAGNSLDSSGNRKGFEKLKSSHPIERLQAFAELLKNPDPQSISYALQSYESLPGGPGRFSELKMLAFAWGQVDPEAALKWAKKQQHWDEHVASSSIMDSWARNDPESAIAWAKGNFDGEDNPYYIGIINGLSESSLPMATDLMMELPYGRVRGRSAHILFEKVWSKGEEVALHWAEHLPEGSLQDFAFGELGEKIAREDLGRAVEWVNSMEESGVKSAVAEDVAREMARQSPVAAGDWVLQLPEGNSKEVVVKEVARIWSKKDPVATAAWINQFPEGTNVDTAIEELVREISSTDPQGALSWAESITNPDRRKKLIEEAEGIIRKANFPNGQTTP